MAGRPREAGTEPASGSGALPSARSGSPDNDESYMEELGNRLAGEAPRPRIPAPNAPAPGRPVRALPRHGRTLLPGAVPAPSPPGKSALPPAPPPARKLTLPPAPRPIPPAALVPPPPPPPRSADLESTRDDRPQRAASHEGPTDEEVFGRPIGPASEPPPDETTGELDPDESSDLLPRGVQAVRPYEDSQFQIVAPQAHGYEVDPFTLVPDAPEMRGKKRDPIDDETEIDNDNFVSEEATSILHEQPAAPMLWVEKGKDVGKEFTIAEGETCVGRGIDNDIILTDIAISRRHLRIERDGDSVILFDLGSGNGSTVNGSKHAKIQLAHGDRIGLGTTVLVVRWPESVARTPDEVEAEPTRMSRGVEPTPLVPVEGGRPAPQGDSVGTPTGTVDPGPAGRARAVAPARERTSSSRAFWIVGGGLAAVLLIGLGAVSAVAIARVLSNGEEVETQMALATASVAARRWAQAETELQKVLEVEPDHALATEYLARVRRERRAEIAIERGRSALANGDAATAITEASSVRVDSLYVDDARALIAQGVARRVDDLLLAADGARMRNDLTLARAKVQEALRLDAQNERARAMAQLLGVSGAALPPAAVVPPIGPSPPLPPPVTTLPAPSPPVAFVPPAPPAPPPAVAPSAPAVAPTPVAAPRTPPPSSARADGDRGREPSGGGAASSRTSDRGTGGDRSSDRGGGSPAAAATPTRGASGAGSSRALALYRSGNFDAAADAARSGGDTRLAGRIEQFAGHWGRIQRAGGNWGSVARDLETAYRLDNQISGGTYGGRLRGPLVSYYVGQARTALGAGQYHTACPKVRAILGLDRGNGAARQMAQQCEQRATQLLSRASAMDRSNPAGARALYRQILLMVPSGTPIHQQAYQRIRALPQTGPVDEDE
ncbi:MAG: FHA domain-containing protein [Deltaproteobacteria bacterium]|nr:FHA domain-containing protein [Deltaproteobacteria bacterium]